MVKVLGLCVLVVLLLGCSASRVGAVDVDIVVNSTEPIDLNIDASSVGGLGITLNGVSVLSELSNIAGGLNEMYFRVADLRARLALLQNATGSGLDTLYSRDNYLAGVVGFTGNSTLAGRLRAGNLTVVEELELLQGELRALNDSLPLLRGEVEANTAGLLVLLGKLDSCVSGLDFRVSGLESGLGSLSAATAGESARQDAMIRAQGDRIAALEQTTDTQTILIVLLGVWAVLCVIYFSSLRSVKKIGATPPR